jgi:hypothetical protein
MGVENHGTRHGHVTASRKSSRPIQHTARKHFSPNQSPYRNFFTEIRSITTALCTTLCNMTRHEYVKAIFSAKLP